MDDSYEEINDGFMAGSLVLPNEGDPFYGNPMYPFGIVLLHNETLMAHYAIIIHHDGKGNLKVWLPIDRVFKVIKSSIANGDAIPIMKLEMDTDVQFLCLQCNRANDLKHSKKMCSKCLAENN